jgi:hypothetical protein
MFGGGERTERGNGGLPAAVGVGDGPCPLAEGNSRRLPGFREVPRPVRGGQRGYVGGGPGADR